MPMVMVDSVDEVRDFYVNKLGFEHRMGVVGKDGKLDFVNIVIGDASVMFSRAPEGVATSADTPKPVELYINVGDVDKHHDQAKAAGIEIVDELTDQWWGDRTYVIKDLNGYRVWFYTNKGEPVPPPGTKIV
jgi:PhnB protein